MSKFNDVDDFKNLWFWFDIFNSKLFDDIFDKNTIRLLLTHQEGSHGYFWKDRLIDAEESTAVHEISINIDTIDRNEKLVISTLVHEMVHFWEVINKTAPNYPYHNKIWSGKMLQIGLKPVCGINNALTGKNCTHAIVPGGKFDTIFESNKSKNNFNFTFKSIYGSVNDADLLKKIGVEGSEISKKVKNKGKNKYKCNCSTVWGKEGLDLMCLDCGDAMVIE